MNWGWHLGSTLESLCEKCLPLDVINQFYIWLKNVAKMEIGSLVNVPKDHAIWLNLALFWIKYFLIYTNGIFLSCLPKNIQVKNVNIIRHLTK